MGEAASANDMTHAAALASLFCFSGVFCILQLRLLLLVLAVILLAPLLLLVLLVLVLFVPLLRRL